MKYGLPGDAPTSGDVGEEMEAIALHLSRVSSIPVGKIGFPNCMITPEPLPTLHKQQPLHWAEGVGLK